MGSKRQAHMVSRALRKQWLGDSLLKVKLQEDCNRETFDNRTVLIRNLPEHINARQLLDIFMEDGAVVGVELPTQNLAIADYLNDRKVAPLAQDKDRAFRAA